VLWNLNQLAGSFTVLVDKAPLLEALNTFAAAYRRALSLAMVRRLGLKPRSLQEDAGLAAAAFGSLAEGGEELRWEPFFFDWFGGAASEDRAMGGPRAAAYRGPKLAELRNWLGLYEPDRPERLDHPYFAREAPEEMLIDEVEAIWAPIAETDDWSAFEAKVQRLREAGAAVDNFSASLALDAAS